MGRAPFEMGGVLEGMREVVWIPKGGLADLLADRGETKLQM